MSELSSILAGIRFAEDDTLNGNYAKRQTAKNDIYLGAYAIPSRYWRQWAEYAGMGGAPWWSVEAQDRVAATVLAEYYNRFGSWDLAIVAWFAGPESATNMMKNGWEGPDSINNEEIKRYVGKVHTGTKEALKPVNAAFLRTIATDNFALTRPGTQWIFPVAGDSEWSGGSFMDKHTKHEGSHHAIDVYAPEGTPIVSPVAGKVLATGSGGRGGNWARILGTDGITYYFAHMAGAARVAKGQQIKAGAHVGFVGDTGSAKGTKPHLHFSMREGGKAYNPTTWLREASVMGYSSRNLRPEDTEMLSRNAMRAGFRDMTAAWIQGTSDRIAGGQRELPELADKQAQLEAQQGPPTETVTQDDEPELVETRKVGNQEAL